MKSKRRPFHDNVHQSATVRQKLLEAAAPTLERIRADRDRVSHRLQPLLLHLESHLFDPALNVEQLRLACGVRDNSMAGIFAGELGLSPSAYIFDARMRTAEALLLHSTLPVWQIGDLIGYSGPVVFGNAFKRWSQGTSAAVFRRRARPTAQRAGAAVPLAEVNLARTWRRALIGVLEPAEAQSLIARLRQLYPQTAAPGRAPRRPRAAAAGARAGREGDRKAPAPTPG